ncbi:MAG: AAA family ATPase [bacterium]
MSPPNLVDFGIALPIEELELTGGDPSDHTVTGTPKYMAPEQVANAWSVQGPPTDLYSLACDLGADNGPSPFKGGSPYVVMIAHLNDPPPPFKPVLPVPPGLEGWLRRLLMKQPMDRYRRAADAAFAFRKLGDVLPEMSDDDQTEVEEDDGATVKVMPYEVTFEPPVVDAGWKSAYDRPPIPLAARERDESRMTLVGSGLGLVGLRTMPLVGRPKERDALWRALLEADKSGTPQAVVLRGPAGVGKSRLAEWFSRHADEVGGAQVLRVLHSENGGATDGLGPAVTRHLRCKGLKAADASQFVQKWLEDRMPNPPRALAESLFHIVTAGYGEVNTSAFFMEPSELSHLYRTARSLLSGTTRRVVDRRRAVGS